MKSASTAVVIANLGALAFCLSTQSFLVVPTSIWAAWRPVEVPSAARPEGQSGLADHSPQQSSGFWCLCGVAAAVAASAAGRRALRRSQATEIRILEDSVAAASQRVEEPVGEVREAALCIVVTEAYAMKWLVDGEWKQEHGRWRWSAQEYQKPPLDTAPMRLRVAGIVEALGCPDDSHDTDWGTYWNNEGYSKGLDLFWEGGRWTSLAIPVPPNTPIKFQVVRLDQEKSHRRFGWGWEYTVESPSAGQVVQAVLNIEGDESADWNVEAALSTRLMCRQRAVVTPMTADPFRLEGADGAKRHPGGVQRLYLFDASNGMSLKSCLYLPPGYREEVNEGRQWPLLIFLHSMHGRLDGDNNLFYGSDTPLELLLLGDQWCPETLRQRFVVLAPECPADKERGDGGVWLRHGWYEDSTYSVEVERALAELFETTASGLQIDRQRICVTGCSMGAYACLELAARWPGAFAAIAPVAAHYDLDPVDDVVVKLTAQQALPMWFFHATNDSICPYPPIESMVAQLRARTQAEVRLHAFEDTWSDTGHWPEGVAYWACTNGNELFDWLAAQTGPGRAFTVMPSATTQSAGSTVVAGAAGSRVRKRKCTSSSCASALWRWIAQRCG